MRSLAKPLTHKGITINTAHVPSPLFIYRHKKSSQNMHFSPSLLLVVLLSLFTFTTGILLPRSGVDTVSDGAHPLEPHIASVPRSPATLDPRSNYPSIIKELFNKRQSCPYVGYSACINGQGCCPTGGDCCGGNSQSPLIVNYQFH